MNKLKPVSARAVVLACAAAFSLTTALAGCQSDPSPHLARVNASILSWVACAGVDHRGEDKSDPKRAACDTASAVDASMDPVPQWGEVWVFNMDQIVPVNPPLPVAAPGQPKGQATIGPYRDEATCKAVVGLLNDTFKLKTYPCESRFMLGHTMLKRAI